jgi:hypothetical protein
VDPNRNFPDPFVKNTPVPNVRGFCDFIQSIKPKAYISMHSFGRVLLTPWGDTDFPNPNHKDYLRIVQAMMKLNGYRTMRICENYGHPIYGVEADWCHRQGVFSIIMETGTHMGVPQDEEIEEELHRTLDSVILFIQQAPDVVIKQPETCPLPAEY